MIKSEFIQAIKTAQRIFVSVRFMDHSPRLVRISKAQMAKVALILPADATIQAEWLDPDDQRFLAVGGK